MSIRGLILDYTVKCSACLSPPMRWPEWRPRRQAAAQPFADACWRYRGDYDRGMPATEMLAKAS